MFEHAVEYNQQFAHGCDQRHLFRWIRVCEGQQVLSRIRATRTRRPGHFGSADSHDL